MKTTVLTIALALATMSLMSAKSQTPAPAANGTDKAPATAAKTTKKHSKKAVKKAAKTPAAPAAAAKPVVK